MAKSSGGGGRSGSGGGPAVYNGPNNAFVRKVRAAYRREYMINKGRSSLTNSEIDRAVSLGILRQDGSDYLMRI